MDKKVIIYGGIGTAVIAGFLYMQNKSASNAAAAAANAAQQQATADANQQQNGYSSYGLSDLSPTAGYTNSALTAPAATGTTDPTTALMAAISAQSAQATGQNALELQVANLQAGNATANNTANLASQVFNKFGTTYSSIAIDPTSAGGYTVTGGTANTPGIYGITAPSSGIGQYQNTVYNNLGAANTAAQSKATKAVLATGRN